MSLRKKQKCVLIVKWINIHILLILFRFTFCFPKFYFVDAFRNLYCWFRGPGTDPWATPKLSWSDRSVLHLYSLERLWQIDSLKTKESINQFHFLGFLFFFSRRLKSAPWSIVWNVMVRSRSRSVLWFHNMTVCVLRPVLSLNWNRMMTFVT